MDLKHLNFSLKIAFFLLTVFSRNAFGQLCAAPLAVNIKENNTIGEVVANITVQEGVSLFLKINPSKAFDIIGNQLVAVKVLDFETLPDLGNLRVEIDCTNGEITRGFYIIVVVENINDNPPVFSLSEYTLQVNEFSALDTSIGRIEATDIDKDRLYYRVIPSPGYFDVKTELDPDIVVRAILDYEITSEVSLTLLAQDTSLTSSQTPSHTATTSIKVIVLDINNRPPWFQPCTLITVDSTKLCLNSGYRGTVNLTEQAAGALPLEPNEIRAIDGDSGRNEPIGYVIIGGNEDALFGIDKVSGSITVQREVDVAGPIILTVMAYETLSPDQYSSTTVTILVVKKSKHPPQFVKPSYQGLISADAGVGSLVMEGNTNNKALQVKATDADFTDGVNPDIIFEVVGSLEFTITREGFILMTQLADPGTLDLTIRVLDTTNLESSTAALAVKVTPGAPSTTTDMSTTIITTTPISTDTSTSSAMTTDIITTVTYITTDISTAMVTQLTETTFKPDFSTSSPGTTSSPHTDESAALLGAFKAEDMAALGASLAVLLLICLVVIGLLVYNLRRNTADWRKLSEASIFRSTLSGGVAGAKDGVQYTNEGFQNDGDSGSLTSKQAAELAVPVGLQSNHKAPEELQSQRSAPSQGNNDSVPPVDTASVSALNDVEGEKEVKPILTKERRVEDGYKAVWFKQDIDPNIKEDVVIIPDSSERDVSHEEDEDEEEAEEEEEEEEEDFSNTGRDEVLFEKHEDDEEGLVDLDL